MKILHTADLHVGQILYQSYDRTDEHLHFFSQLSAWVKEHKPDALVISGDIYDIQQPGAATQTFFNNTVLEMIHDTLPEMAVVITAGNHDSASRLETNRELFERQNVHVVGISPSLAAEQDEERLSKYIIELESGYIIALPHMAGCRKDLIQKILDIVKERNVSSKPVVMMGHLAVSAADTEGHEIGTIISQPVSDLGVGYDYLALGHIHKPQTIGYPSSDELSPSSTYPNGVARYSGSALHVSCDEAYPHTVSLVEISSHGSEVKLHRLRINELRHFHILPKKGPAASAQEAIDAVRDFVNGPEKGYFRMRVNYDVDLPSSFSQEVYSIISGKESDYRFNPKVIWVGVPEEQKTTERIEIQVADLQQMTDPMSFIEKTISKYPEFTIEELREAFSMVATKLTKEDSEEETDNN